VKRARLLGAGATLALLTIGALAPVQVQLTAHAQGTVGFAAPVYVDPVRAGGEPAVMYSRKGEDLIYTSHEGTTHLDRTGLTSPTSVAGFTCAGAIEPTPQPACYENHVWIWTSVDHGKTWTYRDENLIYTGFSDPDLTADAAGNVYNTGINLVNDALFSSSDGGQTWPTGTPNCHEGDRPWLAGGRANEVFMVTDEQLPLGVPGGHVLTHSADAGASCAPASASVPDNGNIPATCSSACETFSGVGKGVVDPVDGSFIEPAAFSHPNGDFGVGISRLPNAAAAFSGGPATFQPVEVGTKTSITSPFGGPEVLRMDSQENLYFAWDTNPRDPNGKNGCSPFIPNASGGPTPKPNQIMFAVGKHVGPGQWQWSTPIALNAFGPARLPGTWVEWPWTTIGTPGNVSVAWYQMDQLVDPDCDESAATGQPPVPDVKTYIYEARITNALDPATRTVTVSNASGRYIHQGGICNSGTTCAATGQDRRLGDYFETNVDAAGCLVISSGDTTQLDPVTGQPRITSLPVFIQQNAGPSLTGQDCGTATATATPPPNTGGSLVNTAAGRPVLTGALALLACGLAALVFLTGRRRSA